MMKTNRIKNKESEIMLQTVSGLKKLIYAVIGLMVGGAVLTYWLTTYSLASEHKEKTVSKTSPQKEESFITSPKDAEKNEISKVEPTEEELIPEKFWPPKSETPIPEEIKPLSASEPVVPEPKRGEAQTFVVQYADLQTRYHITQSDQWLNESEPGALGTSRRTSYPTDFSRVLTSSKIIPAVLYTEIHSELPSETVRAQVEQDVVGYHGWNILIPKGSWAIGRYKPLKKYGDTRLSVEWYRILTPEGIHIELKSKTADTAGREGITGYVDNKFSEKYGVALMLATINTGAQLSVSAEDRTRNSIVDALSDSLKDVTQETLRQNMQLVPSVHIAKGTRILIQPTTDLFFPEPKSNQVIATPLSKEVSEPVYSEVTNDSLEEKAEEKTEENFPKSRKKRRKRG